MGLKYRDIVDRIDVDAFEDEIGFEPLQTKDDNDIGHCPDFWGLHKHGDRSGKFAIHRLKKVYNCWVCGGGSLLSLAMTYTELGEQEAINWLADFCNGEASDDEFVDEIEALLIQDERRRDPILPWFNERVIEPWAQNLSEVADWVQRRGISAQVAREFKLGYDGVHTRPSSKGNYTGPAVIFPHYWGGRVVGWQARWLNEDRPKWIPKYTNTSDFPRQFTIFNYERVYFTDQPIVVCESVPTVLFLASQGFPAVATFGSSVTPEQMQALRRCQQGVIIAPDNDKAGAKFCEALVGYLERYIDVKVTPLVDGEGSDLGDLASEANLLSLVLEAASYPTT